MELLTDRALVDEALGGSEMAFVVLMRRHERLVYRVCFSYTHDRDDAMDVTQNVFLKAYRGLAGIRSHGVFRSWLVRIAQRESLNWLRAQRRRPDCEELTPANMPALGGNQERDVIAREARDQLRRGMDALNPKQRLAIGLRYFEQSTTREIAAALDCSEGVARNILFRGLGKLRGRLTVTMEGES